MKQVQKKRSREDEVLTYSTLFLSSTLYIARTFPHFYSPLRLTRFLELPWNVIGKLLFKKYAHNVKSFIYK